MIKIRFNKNVIIQVIERMLDQPKKAVKNIGFIKEEKE